MEKLPPCCLWTALSASPHPAPNAPCVFLQPTSCPFLSLVPLTMRATSLQSSRPQFFLVRKTTSPLIKTKHLSHFAATWPQLFMGISFPSLSFRARESPGRRIQKGSGFMALQIGVSSNLSSSLSLVSALTCLQPTGCFFALSFCLLGCLHSRACRQDLQLSLLSLCPATFLSLSGLL